MSFAPLTQNLEFVIPLAAIWMFCCPEGGRRSCAACSTLPSPCSSAILFGTMRMFLPELCGCASTWGGSCSPFSVAAMRSVLLLSFMDRTANPLQLEVSSYFKKDADHYSSSYDARMPYMLRLTNDGVAIHGSFVREGWATHGCIGVPLEFARLLFAVTNKGDLVVIIPA